MYVGILEYGIIMWTRVVVFVVGVVVVNIASGSEWIAAV